MLRLVEPALPASRQEDRRQTTPALLFHRTTLHFLSLQRFHRRLQVVAHEVELVQIVLLRGMKCSFRSRQRENEPAVTGIHSGKFENIAKESAVAFRILAVNDSLLSGEHISPSASGAQSRASQLPFTIEFERSLTAAPMEPLASWP